MAYPLLTPSFGSRLSTSAGVLWAAVALAGGGGCLFTDPINMTPSLKIVVTGDLYRKQPASFTAEVSDGDGATPTVRWAHRKVCPVLVTDNGQECGPCDLESANLPDEGASGLNYPVSGSDTGEPFCVWAFATDKHGAVGRDVRLVQPMNRAPVAKIHVVKPVGEPPYPLNVEIELSGERTTDEDDTPGSLEHTWEVTRGGLPVQTAACSQPETSKPWCFVPDRPGKYTVKLIVEDAHDGENFTTIDLVVGEDRFPCLHATMPLTGDLLRRSFDQPVSLKVTEVLDDFDKYPDNRGSKLTFRWFEWPSNGSLSYGGDSFVEYIIPAFSYFVGDEVKVRVEISDRNVEAVKKILRDCGDDADVCAQPAGCYQRLTWKIRF